MDPECFRNRARKTWRVNECEREEERAYVSVSVFQWVLNTAWLLTLVYLFFDVSNTIIKDLFPNPLQ